MAYKHKLDKSNLYSLERRTSQNMSVGETKRSQGATSTGIVF